MNSNTKDCIQEDEIDLKELFKTLWDNKKLVVIITSIVTLISAIYVMLNNPKPIYSGKVLVEIGEIQSDNFGISTFDNPNNLATIIDTMFKSVGAISPKGTNKLLEVSFESESQELIKDNLSKTVDFIIERHEEKAKFHNKYIMSKQIGEIKISDKPINTPKKSLMVVVAFVSGFVLSIFLVFFIQFIRNFKEEK